MDTTHNRARNRKGRTEGGEGAKPVTTAININILVVQKAADRKPPKLILQQYNSS